MLNKLKFIALPKEDESPKSLLMRTAFANGFRSVTHMARALMPLVANARPLSWQIEHSDLVQLIADDAGNYRDSFLSAFYPQLSRITADSPVIVSGVSTPLSKLRRTKYAFCPSCARDGWQRFSQDLSILNACPYHHCAFVHECPKCEIPLTWHLLDKNSCKCGFDLASIESEQYAAQGSEAVLQVYLSKNQEAVGRLSASVKALRVEDESTTQGKEEKLSIAARIALTDKLALKDAILAARSQHPELPQSMTLAPWSSIADNWIKESVNEISSRWDLDCPEITEASSTNIYFYRDEIGAALQLSAISISSLLKSGLINRHKRQGTLSWIYTANDWLNVITQAKITSNPKKPHELEKFIDINSTANALHTYPDAIRRAIKAGIIPNTQQHDGKTLISKAVIDQFRSEYIFIGELAKNLGASNTTLRARLKAVGINPVSGPNIDGGLVSIYKRSTLDSDRVQQSLVLKTYPNAAGPKKHDQPATTVNALISTDAAAHLGIAMQRLRHLQNLGLLEEAVQLNLGTDYRRYFTKTSVATAKEWLDTSMTLENAALETNLSTQAFARRFINSGFIRAMKVGRICLISKLDLSKIIDNLAVFCSCDQADRFLRAPDGHTSNLISTNRLRVASPTETGIYNIRLLRWTDVKALLK